MAAEVPDQALDKNGQLGHNWLIMMVLWKIGDWAYGQVNPQPDFSGPARKFLAIRDVKYWIFRFFLHHFFLLSQNQDLHPNKTFINFRKKKL